MKKVIYFLTALFSCHAEFSMAQGGKETASPVNIVNREQIENAGRNNIEALLASIPVGKGADNYSYGAGIRVQRNFNRSMIIIDGISSPGNSGQPANDAFNITPGEVEKYGSVSGALKDIERIEIIRSGFTAEFGGTRLFGKTETIGNISYSYDGLSILHLFGGFHYMPCAQGDLQLELGPALGIFPNGSEFGFAASVSGYYNFTPPAKRVFNIITTGKKKPEWSVGAGVDLFKLNEVDPILLPGLKIRLSF